MTPRFHGVIGSQAAGWLWPSSRLLGGAWTRGVPVNLDVADAGLIFSPRTRFLRGKRWAPVTLAWDELGGASATSRGHTGRTGGLTLHKTFEVTLKVVGPRAAGFAPLVVTMPHGDDLAAAVTARATGHRSS